MRNSSILPLGKINLKTGNSKYFNVYDTWGEGSTYEVYQIPGGLRIVATWGKTPLCKMGENRSFCHDQTGRYLFQGTLIDFATGTDLKKLAEKYGNSISGYTYK
jgi:hypothetical protein